jgi:NADPH-dependent glutamate synthase beta subunit-like oxidoreductase
MRFNIPAFRLPVSVLDEETRYIIDMGADVRYNTRVESMKSLLEEGYDAVFVGSGAPKGKELNIPGRWDDGAKSHIHIGIEWLGSVHFGHIDSIAPRVLIIGVGNTAMDCCRTSRRLGGVDTKVVARRSRQYFKASPWELEDAQEEGIEIVENHSPKRFVIENGKLAGMEFDTANGSVILPCDEVILAIGQDNAFPWIERDIGIAFDEHDMPVIDKITFESTKPGVFFGGDSAWGPANIIWAVEHGHQAAISIHQHCNGVPVAERPPEGMHLESTKMGMHSWAYSNDFNPSPRAHMKHAELVERFSKLSAEVELGFTPEQTATEVERCLNCDIETHFEANLCIECDACVDVCPVSCLTIAPAVDNEIDLRTMLSAPAVNLTQDIYISAALPQTKRLMVKDEDICLHCGLCAERCPTAAWDMKKFELVLPYASAPSGSQSVSLV